MGSAMSNRLGLCGNSGYPGRHIGAQDHGSGDWSKPCYDFVVSVGMGKAIGDFRAAYCPAYDMPAVSLLPSLFSFNGTGRNHPSLVNGTNEELFGLNTLCIRLPPRNSHLSLSLMFIRYRRQEQRTE